MERDDRRSRPEDRPPAPALHRSGAARICAGGPALSGEPDRTDPTPALWRRIKIAFVAGGIVAAAAAMFLALFRDVTIGTLIALPGIVPLLAGAFLVVAVSGTVAGIKRLARGFRSREPWRYRAWPTEEAPFGSLIYVKVTVQLAHLVAMAVTGLVAVAAVPFGRGLAASLFQALLLVLVGGAMAGVTLTAAIRIEWLVRWLHSLRRPVSRARP